MDLSNPGLQSDPHSAVDLAADVDSGSGPEIYSSAVRKHLGGATVDLLPGAVAPAGSRGHYRLAVDLIIPASAARADPNVVSSFKGNVAAAIDLSVDNDRARVADERHLTTAIDLPGDVNVTARGLVAVGVIDVALYHDSRVCRGFNRQQRDERQRSKHTQ